MTAQQKTGSEKSKPQPSSGSDRKPWVKKTPVQVVLDQIHKQEERVAGMEKDLGVEKRELHKLLEAKKVLEAK